VRRKATKGDAVNVLAARVAIRNRVELLNAMERISNAVCTSDTTGYSTCRLCGCAQNHEQADHFSDCPVSLVERSLFARERG
jgi:hypothetical protein